MATILAHIRPQEKGGISPIYRHALGEARRKGLNPHSFSFLVYAACLLCADPAAENPRRFA
jgi:hypothetical protein